MYLAIDVGASKSLLAVFDEAGKVVDERKIVTAKDYSQFLAEISKIIQALAAKYQLKAACCALPGRIDRQNGIGLFFSNLPWKHVAAKEDLSKLLGDIPIFIENDAKLAALSEALLIQERYKKVLYITISTGIGGGYIIDGKLDPEFLNMESGQMLLEHQGQTKKWEQWASGKALVEHYGKKAAEIDDPAIWKEYSALVALGLDELLSTIQPEVVVIGGGVGTHLEKFQPFLEERLQNIKNPLVPIPPILKAQRPEEAVIYGCYEYIKQSKV